jgi:hypothetical protein
MERFNTAAAWARYWTKHAEEHAAEIDAVIKVEQALQDKADAQLDKLIEEELSNTSSLPHSTARPKLCAEALSSLPGVEKRSLGLGKKKIPDAASLRPIVTEASPMESMPCGPLKNLLQPDSAEDGSRLAGSGAAAVRQLRRIQSNSSLTSACTARQDAFAPSAMMMDLACDPVKGPVGSPMGRSSSQGALKLTKSSYAYSQKSTAFEAVGKQKWIAGDLSAGVPLQLCGNRKDVGAGWTVC